MTLRSPWLVVSLALLGAIAPLRESVAAAKADLEKYLGDVPMVGDQKVAVSPGDERISTILSVTPDAKQTVVVSSTTQDSDGVTETDLEVIVHGKELRLGTVELADPNSGTITFFTPRPRRAIRFQLKPGKAYPFNVPSRVLVDGQKAGKAKNYGKVTFLGIEDVTTPAGRFANTAHFTRTDNLRVKLGKHVLESKGQIEWWIDDAVGTVRFIESSAFFEDKVMTESHAPVEWTLDHGIVDGQPFPQPAPTGGSAGAVAGGASAGIDLVNADAGATVTLSSPPPTGLVGTGVVYVPGVNYSRGP